jgi:hypothetical protein|tara:strand:+ start:6247 stop:6690 length:444 start_codon:yes stop_codon:yes gene_type:complete
MGSINKRPLNAYVRYDGSGRVVAGSLVLRRKIPKVGNWKELPANIAYECCYPTTTTTSTTAIVYPAGQVSSASDASNACALTLDTVVYLKLATANVVAVGSIVYNDAAGLNPFDGSGAAHRVEAPDGQDWNAVIGVDGAVTATNLCA